MQEFQETPCPAQRRKTGTVSLCKHWTQRSLSKGQPLKVLWYLREHPGNSETVYKCKILLLRILFWKCLSEKDLSEGWNSSFIQEQEKPYFPPEISMSPLKHLLLYDVSFRSPSMLDVRVSDNTGLASKSKHKVTFLIQVLHLLVGIMMVIRTSWGCLKT